MLYKHEVIKKDKSLQCQEKYKNKCYRQQRTPDHLLICFFQCTINLKPGMSVNTPFPNKNIYLVQTSLKENNYYQKENIMLNFQKCTVLSTFSLV